MPKSQRSNYKLISTILKLADCTKVELFLLVIGIIASAIFVFIRPQVICRLTDQGLENKDLRLVMIWCVGLLIISLFDNANELLQIKIFTCMSNKFTRRLYLEALSSILSAPYELSKTRTATEMVSTICTDVEKTSLLIDRNMLTAITGMFQVIGGIAGMFVLKWEIAIMIICVIPIKQALIIRLSKQRVVLASDLLSKFQAFSEWLGEQINGVFEIKLWNLYSGRIKVFIKKYRDIMDINKKLEMCDGIENSGRCIIDQIIEVIIYIYCGFLVCSNHMSLGGLLAVIAYSTNITAPMDYIANIPYIWSKIRPSVERLYELFAWPTEDIQSICAKNDSYDLTLDKVSFGFDEEHQILEDVSINIPYGSKIAIIGENGSGKTTLVNIILGIIRADAGTISLGEQDIYDLGLEKWRDCFAVVNQNSFLFKGTIGENVFLKESLDLSDLENHVIHNKANGLFDSKINFYHQILLENGKDLSCGERQKIAILRALCKDSKIVIMDESLSNLDSESRARMHEFFLSPDFHKTVIIISHYEEDIMGVQQIYRLREGHVETISI